MRIRKKIPGTHTCRPAVSSRRDPLAKTAWKPGNALFPSPAALVSCQMPGGKPNLITIGWCGNINSTPPMLSISLRPIRHSYAIIEETREFAVNIPSVDLAQAVDYCGVVSGAKVDKFAVTGLTPEPAQKIACPLVKECPINIECQVVNRLPLGSHVMYVAEVVAVSAMARLITPQGKFNIKRANILCYAHGTYFPLGQGFGSFGWSVAAANNRKASAAKKIPGK